jgi:hypothetical protein
MYLCVCVFICQTFSILVSQIYNPPFTNSGNISAEHVLQKLHVKNCGNAVPLEQMYDDLKRLPDEIRTEKLFHR